MKTILNIQNIKVTKVITIRHKYLFLAILIVYYWY